MSDIDDKFNRLWTSYPSDLCNKKRGGKQNAIIAFAKINPDDDEFDRMMRNMSAQIKSDRSDHQPYRWPFVSSYLNQGRYDDYIDSTPDKAYERDKKECSVEVCSEAAHGDLFNKCAYHIGNRDKQLREAYIAVTDKMESKIGDEGYQKACVEFCKNMGYNIRR